MENTGKYAKSSVVRTVKERIEAKQKVLVKEIYVGCVSPHTTNEEDEDPIESSESTWKAALINAPTQSMKTYKCIDVLCDKINELTPSLVLYITQANSITSAVQMISRAQEHPRLTQFISKSNIVRSNTLQDDGVFPARNMMVIDFWKSNNMERMKDLVTTNKNTWKQVIIVIDECEQGNQKGLKHRLMFIRDIEKVVSPKTQVKVILVTATTPNLSKSILRIGYSDESKFKKGVVHDIVNKKVVEHYYAQPHETYVGASWFVDAKDKDDNPVWKKLIFEKKHRYQSKEEYEEAKQDTIFNELKDLPDQAKEMCLVVASARQDDHKYLAKRLFNAGFNVTVQLNGSNGARNYEVYYKSPSGNRKKWMIPYTKLESLADDEDLSELRVGRNKPVQTSIEAKEDLSMSHILQASLFMGQEQHDRIKQYTQKDEFLKLKAIHNAIINKLSKTYQRPSDFPESPRVALIGGLIASRGTTIQNPFIDFTCTSFCFVDSKDANNRGATNTQKFGRACGSLLNAFARPDRTPIVIATEGIMKDAVANEKALKDNLAEIEDGALVALKDLITDDDWRMIVKSTKDDLKEISEENDSEVVDGVSMRKLREFMTNKNTIIYNIIKTLYENKTMQIPKLKTTIKYTGDDEQFTHNINTGRSIKCLHGKLWCVNGKSISLNPRIRDVIESQLK